MSLEEKLDLDGNLLEGAEKVARLYQSITGKHKDNLAYGLNIAAGITSIAWGVGIIETFPIFAPVSILEAYTDYGKAKKIKEKLRTTEKVPGYGAAGEYEKAFKSTFVLVDTAFMIGEIALATVSGYKQDYRMMRTYLSIGGMFLSNNFRSASYYIERADIEPPSGKSVFVKLKESLEDFANNFGKVWQPSPIPVGNRDYSERVLDDYVDSTPNLE
jgi:hypothetical protein